MASSDNPHIIPSAHAYKQDTSLRFAIFTTKIVQWRYVWSVLAPKMGDTNKIEKGLPCLAVLNPMFIWLLNIEIDQQQQRIRNWYAIRVQDIYLKQSLTSTLKNGLR